MNEHTRKQYVFAIAPNPGLVIGAGYLLALLMASSISFAVMGQLGAAFGWLAFASVAGVAIWIAVRHFKRIAEHRLELSGLSDDELRTLHSDHMALKHKSSVTAVAAVFGVFLVLCMVGVLGQGGSERRATAKFHQRVIDHWNDLNNTEKSQARQNLIHFAEFVGRLNASDLDSQYQTAFRRLQTDADRVAQICVALPNEDDTFGQLVHGLGVVNGIISNIPDAPAEDAGMLKQAGYYAGVIKGLRDGIAQTGVPGQEALAALNQSIQNLDAVAQSAIRG